MKKQLIKITTLFALIGNQLLPNSLTAQVYYIGTVAGNGTAGYSGDGSAATAAKLDAPSKVYVDATGNLLIADNVNNRIREVNTSGTISTIAGTGTAGYSGDGSAATAAKINSPEGLTEDGSGNIYICDNANHCVRKINTSGVISTFAGTGTTGFSGDGGAATAAKLAGPYGIAIDASNNVYIADVTNNDVRMVNSSGTISTFAGAYPGGYYSGDGAAATAAILYAPYGVAVDANGNVYIADEQNERIRIVNTSGTISTFAGTGTGGYSGDGSAATAAKLFLPFDVAVDALGNVLIADYFNYRIRKVNTSGIISTVVGNGTNGFSGDGGVATSAEISSPTGVATDTKNNIYIADNGNNRVRKSSIFSVTMTQTIGRCNLDNSTATGTPSGGISPYTYSWSPGGQTTQTATGLSPGWYTVTVTDNNSQIATGTIDVHCNKAAFQNNASDIDVPVIFPNPSKGLFTVEGTYLGSNIEIYNEFGYLVKTIKTDNNSIISIDASNIPDGIYFIRIIDTDGSILKQDKIMKVH